ncbi:MAG TPA: hypothetical protein VKR24_03015 [Candidatus Limnocylindrales bacterium]|nr:hypothetical protein [Candidatus Limnocylindrales bacterium]
MSEPIRVMIERGKKKKVVVVAFDWPGWDRSAKTEEGALQVLEAYRPRYAKIAALAGLADEFAAAGAFEVVQRIEGNGMTDYYGLSGRPAEPELRQMSDTECERKIALLRACWTYFDDVAARVSPQLRDGPRGGGRDTRTIVGHVNITDLRENSKKVGVRSPEDTWKDPVALRAHRDAIIAGIRAFNAIGPAAGSWWTVQFFIRRNAWHLLDHAWEMEDRDLSGA